MNCLDYRRILLSQTVESEEMKEHRLGCDACGHAFAEQAKFEAELRLGFEVPLPPGLERRLLHAATTPRRRFLAAAGIAAAAGGLGAYSWLRREDALALACIQFVMKDEAKSIMMGAMPRAEAARVLASSLPLERLERIGQIRHIGPCPFNGSTAYHVVLAVPQGKVTLLIMPDTRLVARKRAIHEGLYAAVVGLREASVGIVGADRDVVDSVAGALHG